MILWVARTVYYMFCPIIIISFDGQYKIVEQNLENTVQLCLTGFGCAQEIFHIILRTLIIRTEFIFIHLGNFPMSKDGKSFK